MCMSSSAPRTAEAASCRCGLRSIAPASSSDTGPAHQRSTFSASCTMGRLSSGRPEENSYTGDCSPVVTSESCGATARRSSRSSSPRTVGRSGTITATDTFVSRWSCCRTQRAHCRISEEALPQRQSVGDDVRGVEATMRLTEAPAPSNAAITSDCAGVVAPKPYSRYSFSRAMRPSRRCSASSIARCERGSNASSRQRSSNRAYQSAKRPASSVKAWSG